MTVSFRPAGYTTLSPMVVVDDAARALEFYRDAFGAEQTYCLPMGDKIGHAEVRIGDTRLMVMDENPEWGANAPKSLGGATGSFMIYVPDADAAIERAVQAGARVVQPAEDQFWGDRTGTVVDPFGHKWMLGTHIEDVSPAEMDKRGKEWVARHQDDAGATMTSTAKSAARPAAKKATKKSAH